jgi:hypothetical protein
MPGAVGIVDVHIAGKRNLPVLRPVRRCAPAAGDNICYIVPHRAIIQMVMAAEDRSRSVLDKRVDGGFLRPCQFSGKLRILPPAGIVVFHAVYYYKPIAGRVRVISNMASRRG